MIFHFCRFGIVLWSVYCFGNPARIPCWSSASPKAPLNFTLANASDLANPYSNNHNFAFSVFSWNRMFFNRGCNFAILAPLETRLCICEWSIFCCGWCWGMNSCSNKVGIARFVRRFADFRLNDKIRIARQICLLNRKIMSPFDFGSSDRRHLTACLTRRLFSPEDGLNTQKLAVGALTSTWLLSKVSSLSKLISWALQKQRRIREKT